MDISNLLVGSPHSGSMTHIPQMPPPPPQDLSYSTRRASTSLQTAMAGPSVTGFVQHPMYPGLPPMSASPVKAPPKTVNFQLLLSEAPRHRARLPLKVNINVPDSTESIIATVKNFYGLYEGEGVSFQDSNGVTIIATYENLEHNSVIHVRVTPEMTGDAIARRNGLSPRKARLGEPFQMMPPPTHQPYSRPNSRASKKRSASPSVKRSTSARAQQKSKTKAGAVNASHEDNEVSDSDNGSVSVSSSRKEQLSTADISLDNIVEGGRRKRAKFESSELPLFAPPQQPSASISSMSPQRRAFPNVQSPINNQFMFGYGQPLPSPQSYGQNEYITSNNGNFAAPQQAASRSRARAYSSHGPSRLSGGSTTGLLPTPDPTIGSVISDEDVALQLMRLGDAANFAQGRMSTSTVDDAQSGHADAASSDGETDVEYPAEQHPPVPATSNQKHTHSGHARKKVRAIDAVLSHYDDTESSENEYGDNDGSFNGESDEMNPNASNRNGSRARSKSTKPRSNSVSVKGQAKPRAPSLSKVKSKSSMSSIKIPPSPYGATPVLGRKASSASTINNSQLGVDEDDLSSKPRCQRCRKSKKGCDRQRPCQRCKDAGIGADGCVSEDEGNGRKGRYGRHMGVAIKRDSLEAVASVEQNMDTSLSGYGYSPTDSANMDNNKKRKR